MAYVDVIRHWAVLSLMILITMLQPLTGLQAAEPSPQSVTASVIQPGMRIGGIPARERTSQEMERDATVEAIGNSGIDWLGKLPFRTTISDAEYEHAKVLAETVEGFQTPSTAPEAPVESPAAPVLKSVNFEGVNQTKACGTCRPPDTYGAVGRSQFVEVTNSHLDIYAKVLPNKRVKSVSLATLFAYSAELLFDPRAVFDARSNRWIITAAALPESTTVQKFFIAVSKTGSATGAFFIYSLDVGVAMGSADGDLFDFPQLGMDHNSIIITANIFGTGNVFKGTRLLTIAKSLLYNGATLEFQTFNGLAGSLAPPVVLDNNPKTFLVAAPLSGSSITLYTLENSNIPASATVTQSSISVPAYTLPPNAKQPGTTNLLDSADARFIAASTQVGDSLFQVHTINEGGRPMPRFYEFNTVSNSVIQLGTFAASATSHDWNASIAANKSKDVFVTWSSTDRPSNVNAQVRYSGRRATDPLGVIGAGATLSTSHSFYNPSSKKVERWGDYSAVTIDPRNALRAWIVNEKIKDKSTWSSRIGRIGF